MFQQICLEALKMAEILEALQHFLTFATFYKFHLIHYLLSFLDFKEETLDSSLLNLTNQLSKEGKNILKEIIIHIDKNY